MRFTFFLPAVLIMSASSGFCAPADFVGASAPFAVEHTTEVPGDTLKSGSYSISVVEQIADRMIVRIDSTSSTNHALFLAVPSSATKIGGNTGAVVWPAGVNKSPTLRGFVFPNGNAVEFVYPKAEAAALAKNNSAAVVAIDPRSEGRAALKNLSHDELEIVNLWLLSLTSTGPDNKTPAVLARHYDPADLRQPAVASEAAPVYSVQQRAPSGPAQSAQGGQRRVSAPAPLLAQQTAAATTVAPRASAGQGAVPAKRSAVVRPAAPASSQVAQLEEPSGPRNAAVAARKAPLMAQLPHTGSFLPLVWMLGLLSLVGSGLAGLAVRRSVS